MSHPQFHCKSSLLLTAFIINYLQTNMRYSSKIKIGFYQDFKNGGYDQTRNSRHGLVMLD